MSHAQSSRGSFFPVNQFASHGRFGRLFPNLKGLQDHPGIPRNLGALQGPMQEAKSFSEDNPSIPAGFTYFGQFLTHDITFDTTSSLERRNDPSAILNFRTPAFELDSIYGTGPDDMRYLYRRDGSGQFILPLDEQKRIVDLPRNVEDLAVIADPRNDENLIISQLQLAFLKVHNHLTTRFRSDPHPFKKAQQVLRWHYQWIILHEYMPLVCGDDVADRMLKYGRKHFRWGKEPFIPVEFSVAAFRFGHSQVRAGYEVSPKRSLPLFKDLPPVAQQAPNLPRVDLRGRQRVTSEWKIDWRLFFDMGDGVKPQPSRKINTRLAGSLFQLPSEVAGAGDLAEHRNLAERDIERGLRFQIPSGQDVAFALGLTPLDDEDLWQETGGMGHAPLWFYILREAELIENGLRLGPVGATIVSEVLYGLVEGDLESYLNRAPAWKPYLQEPLAGDFRLAHLLRLADKT